MKMMSRSVTLLGLLFLYSCCCNSQNSCDFNVKVTQVVHNEGFHRNITYGISFNSNDAKSRWLYTNCVLGVDQPLPAGIYVNPDELSDLRRLGRIKAIPKNRINVELRTEQASPSSVYLIEKVTSDQVYLWLPVHARYHQAVPGGGTARNKIDPPKLYLRCPDRRLAFCDNVISPAISFLCNGSSREECDTKLITFTMMTDTLIWDVPVGNTNHYYVVAAGTAIAFIAGSIYLLKTIHDYKLRAKKRKY